jgi:preprotein translocase subunit SecA
MVRSKLDEIFNLRKVDHSTELPHREKAVEDIGTLFEKLEKDAGEQYQEILRFFLLDSLDRNWKEHLLNMDHLKEGIGLRGYGQKDPKQEYKREGFSMFQDLLFRIKENTFQPLTRLQLQEVHEEEFKHEEQKDLQYAGGEAGDAPKKEPVRRAEPKVGRNDPCPCGSGKKYKHCHGKK